MTPLKPCRNGHLSERDASRRCKECRRIADANRKEQRQRERARTRLDPDRRGKCVACLVTHRALNAAGRCVQGCSVGRRQRGEEIARMQVLNDLILSLSDRLWRASMSWERADLMDELSQAQREMARLQRNEASPGQ